MRLRPWTGRSPRASRATGGLDQIYTLGMPIRPILQLGDPRLRVVGSPVTSFGKPLHALLDEMTEVMRKAPGVGLAAQQIGESQQVCVIEVDGQLHELVNPRILRADGDQADLEGCLSLAGYYAPVTRRNHVVAEAYNRLGRKVRLEGHGLLARAIQHELDHLNGRLYIDLLPSLDVLIPPGGRPDDEEEPDAEPGDPDAALARDRQPSA